MKTLLVIGGSGFFGKSILDGFSRNLLNPWHISKVIVMSRNAETLLDEAPQLVGQGVELYSADITKTDFLPHADYVIHAAASTDLSDYLSKPEEEKKNIQAGTYHYCELARKYHSKSKIVYVSSGAVYGAQPSSVPKIDETYLGDISELTPGKLDYAMAKKDAEAAVSKLGHLGLSVSIARCFTFVGPWLPLNQHFAVGNFIGNVIRGETIKVEARNNVYRSYMHTDDLIKWLMVICKSASSICPVYNVGSDDAVDVKELAIYLGNLYQLNVDIPIQSGLADNRYVPSTNKARIELGLYLNINSFEAITKTIKTLIG